MISDLFSVKSSPELGRYGVALTDLRAGDVVFEEIPFAIGPKSDSCPVCLGCNAFVEGTEGGSRCPKCSWPLCENCVDSKWHQPECEIFQKKGVKFQNLQEPYEICHQLDCITPLRVLLQKDANPDRWKKEVEIMEDHDKDRRDLDAWKADETNIVNYIRGACGLDKYSSDLIQKVIGILEVNAFESPTLSGNTVRCLYPKLAIFSHSCVPNLTHSISLNGDYKMVCRTSLGVPKDGVLNNTYTHTLWGTLKRQQHLKNGKFFICKCDRCLDPTELGTHFSSLKCQKCDPGWICSTNPLNPDSEWNCTNCSFKSSGQNVQKMITVIENEIAMIDNWEYDAKKMEATEKLFKTYKSVFHPNHYIMTGLSQQLIQMIGRVEGYELDELPAVFLEHKIDLIRRVLSVLDIVEPGKTRPRANILFELHIPLIYLAKTAYAAGLLYGEPLKEKFKEVIQILEECKEVLDWEDENSSEGELAKISAAAIQQLTTSLNSIE